MRCFSISYDVGLSKKIGINSAIFISFLDMFINGGDERIIVDKELIYDRTGLDFEMQDDIEKKLTSIGLLTVRKVRNSDCKNYYGIDYTILEKVLYDDSFQIDSNRSSLSKKEKMKKETKEEKHLKELKRCIDVDDEVLKQSIFDWIDSVHEAGKYMTTQAVKLNVKQLMLFSSSQKDRLDVLSISIKNGWKDLNWAMERLKKSKDSRNFANYGSIKFEDESLSDKVF
jgi:hypothetical protein